MTLVVLVTCPNARHAARLATALVQRRLAACVNLVPRVDSVFWWAGKVARAREVLLMAKTTSARFPQLERAVRSLHPYQVPEIIALPVARGHAAYLKWVASSVATPIVRRA